MGVYRWWQTGPGRPGGGGGGGRRAPVGGPQSPSATSSRRATPEPDRELVGTATAPRASLTPLVDDAVEVAAPADAASSWVEPLDGGTCPPSHPIKANDSSRIYHVPGGRFYDRTVAVRCYADPDAAAADGYRQAKA